MPERVITSVKSERVQRGGDCRPGLAMQNDIPCAIGAKLDDVQTSFRHAVCNRLSKRSGVLSAMIRRPVQLGDRLEVEAMGSSEELLEMPGMRCLREKRENASAVIVDHDYGRID